MPDDEKSEKQKPDSTGTNSRPRTESIAQTESGLPDDSGTPVEIDPKEEKQIEKNIRAM